MDLDLLAFLDEQRDLNFHPGLEHCGLGDAAAGGVAAYAHLGRSDDQLDVWRKDDANRLAVVAVDLHFDVVIVDPQSLPHSAELAARLATEGSQLIVADVATGDSLLQHDPEKLAALFSKIFS